MVTGHERQLSLWQMPMMKKVWDHTFIESEVQLRTFIDPTATIVISSSTNKNITIYEAATGAAIARCSPGEISTAMCLT